MTNGGSLSPIFNTSDPNGLLQNWTVATSACDWIGVTCGERHHRVTALNISNMGLTGTIHPVLGNLSFLVSIDISSNNFGMPLPEDLLRLRRLKFFRLGHNNFTGDVPSWMSLLPQLQFLSLRNNTFTSLNSFLKSSTNESKLNTLDVSFNSLWGEIPKAIGNLGNLQVLSMKGNMISGPFPSSITNLSHLEALSLSQNSIRGIVPDSIGNLQNLKLLDLQSNELRGSIPSSIFNISTLENIGFTSNLLSGPLPDDMCLGLPKLSGLYLSRNKIDGQLSNFSLCSQLQILSLSINEITGILPREIGSLEMLEKLLLGENNLTGQIPSEIGKLHNLLHLGLERNFLTGSIPLALSNLTFLQKLALQNNMLTGFLPDGFRNLTMLTVHVLSENNFTGAIPRVFDQLTRLEVLSLGANEFTSSPMASYIFNISTLRVINLAYTSVSGNLPSHIGTFLPNIEELYLSTTNLSGVLPSSITNCSHLKLFDLSGNKFSGSLPNSFGNLKFLKILHLEGNNFTSESTSAELSFISSLTGCRYLQYLAIGYNPLKGTLPVSVGNLSSFLQMISASNCKIEGTIPNAIGNLSALLTLDLSGNDLTGMIPSTLGKLSNLQRFSFDNNRLTGFIPNSLCNLQNLGVMSLGQNKLTGSIPECLGKLTSLRYIHLNSNNFTSTIPDSIWSLKDLLELNISSNSFTGSLSPQIGKLKAATIIDLSLNQFSNEIPNTFEDLKSVTNLSMAYNRFTGSIPESIGSMVSLISLDLSHNMLTGRIPKSLESLIYLEDFNVSFNELFGEIPTSGTFRNFTGQSFAFNSKLCGSPRFQVSPCKEVHRSNNKKVLRAVFIVRGIVALMSFVTIAFIMIKHRRKQKPATTSVGLAAEKNARFSYLELSRATNGFNDSNLLGKGSFGSVYKGVLEDGTVLAIKVFNMLLEAASNTFDVECEVLRNLRHRNVIKVVGCCSNLDFKALVLEYMPHGSLDRWLYSDNCTLDIMQRLSTKIDVASALEYLHHGYSTSVVHCDLKPSNVLIDENMTAHVSDFSITKFLSEEGSITHTRTLATLGYMAPEYGLDGIVSIKCDVYSYGILLLETFTRKQLSNEMFSGDISLKNWVKSSLPDSLIQVVDTSLLSPQEEDFNKKLSCISFVLKLALRCSEDSPRERMKMEDIVAKLKQIKIEFMGQEIRKW